MKAKPRITAKVARGMRVLAHDVLDVYIIAMQLPWDSRQRKTARRARHWLAERGYWHAHRDHRRPALTRVVRDGLRLLADQVFSGKYNRETVKAMPLKEDRSDALAAFDWLKRMSAWLALPQHFRGRVKCPRCGSNDTATSTIASSDLRFGMLCLDCEQMFSASAKALGEDAVVACGGLPELAHTLSRGM